MDSIPFLTTKFHIPVPHPGLVARPRLFEQLNAGIAGKMSLVSAPAGFGKTTLVSAWGRQTGRPFAWLSVDELDNDPQRFLTYLVRALQGICPHLGTSVLESLQASQFAGIASGQVDFLENLLSEMAESSLPFLFVLDDYHVIENPIVQGMMQFLLAHQPPMMHLVISTRADPPWPLGRLRVRQQVNEIRAADLRFTIQETSEFFQDRLELTQQEIALLDGRTEGWAAGLQLAAISLHGQSNTRQFVENLAGSNRFISDYLVEEVLDKQPPAIQEFLLKTSILDRVNARLCDELLLRTDSQATLLFLEQSNLFLQSLDDERCWYRYHHLFADLLRIRLGMAYPAAIPELHRRASQWLEANGLVVMSVRHALAATDFERVTRLVNEHAFSMLETGEFVTLSGWLDALPRPLILAQPWMCIFYAWTLAYTGQLNDADRWLLQAEAALPGFCEHADTTSCPREHLLGQIAAVRVLLAKNQGEMVRMTDCANEALRYLPEHDYKTRCYVAQILGQALTFLGQYDMAAQVLQDSINVSQKAGDIYRLVHALCDLGGLQWMRGQRNAAEANFGRALSLAKHGVGDGRQYALGASFAYNWLGRAVLERNDIQTARQYIEEGLALSQKHGQADILMLGMVARAEMQFASKDIRGALVTFQKARPKTGSGAAWHDALLDQFESEYLLSLGDLSAAEKWLQKLDWKIGEDIPDGQTIAFEFVARILLAKGQYTTVLDIIDQLLVREEAGANTLLRILLQFSQALAWQALGKVEQALKILGQAISQAGPEGYTRIFLDRGAPMRRLLQKAAERDPQSPHVHRLLAAFEVEEAQIRSGGDLPIEPLSARELAVLRLLAAELESHVIAEKLVISTNTVRTHIKNIYRKLNAHSRYEAVVSASTLRLL